MKKDYFVCAGIAASLLISAGAAVYSYIVGKKFQSAIDTIDDYNEEIEEAVEDAVNDAYEETKADVKAELTKQILNLDISEIKAQIIREAAEKVRDRLEDYVVDSLGEAAVNGNLTEWAKGELNEQES